MLPSPHEDGCCRSWICNISVILIPRRHRQCIVVFNKAVMFQRMTSLARVIAQLAFVYLSAVLVQVASHGVLVAVAFSAVGASDARV